jgi:FKBP-type peptidyl-prolyl cis-trans isomerase (trigger factor)
MRVAVKRSRLQASSGRRAPVDVVQQEWERAYGPVQKQARLPGFEGHVPRSLVKVHFSDDVRRGVAEHLIPTSTARR